MIKFKQFLLEGSEHRKEKKKTVDKIVDSVIYAIKHLHNKFNLSNVNSISFKNDPGFPKYTETKLSKNIKINLDLDNLYIPQTLKINLFPVVDLINSTRLKDAEYNQDNDVLLIELNIPIIKNLEFLMKLKDSLSSALFHELKHMAQEIEDVGDLEGFDYLSHPDEVESWVNQFYHMTRIRKNRSLREQIIYFIGNASKQYKLSDKQKNKLIDLYIEYAKKMKYNLDRDPRMTLSKYYKEDKDLKKIAGELLSSKNLELKKELLEKLGNLNYQDKDGNTLLHYISNSDSKRKDFVLSWLMNNYEIDSSIKNRDGKSAIDTNIKSKFVKNHINRVRK